ncbi:MAG: hypothetical protein IRZ00_14130 [Gemmatimonadetes bacterium]|nr:hypothetical protein [Gemmatimonadota bacterium]
MQHSRRPPVLPFVALLATLALAACGDDSPAGPPTQESVAGVYQASAGHAGAVFEITALGQTTDVLAAGATIRLELKADGSTAGRLFVPGGDEDGSDLDADLTGTWTLQGDTVRLSHAADTFLRDIPLVVSRNQLTADQSFGGVRVRVSLVK